MDSHLSEIERIGPLPRSIAIAGAWGYIGRRFVDVALAHGLKTFVFDPGPLPADLDASKLTRLDHPDEFYGLTADVFHLAVHPEHRRVERLLGREDRTLILNEKPMAAPEHPDECLRILDAVASSPSIMLYDFPELFEPMTERIHAFLGSFRQVRIDSIFAQRSKDREDPANPRNYKRMVSIQYQETVHCLAFLLSLLNALKGSLGRVLEGGITVRGESRPYTPPNPEAYPHPVDGRCRYRMSIGGVAVDGCTDFKRGAHWEKRRVIRGTGDGVPFEIEVSFLEGKKFLRINGIEQPCDPAGSSYESVLRTIMSWARRHHRNVLMEGNFPNPQLARLTYQLSSALWRSCHDRAELRFESLDQLNGWNPGYAHPPLNADHKV